MEKIKDIDFNNKEIVATEYHFLFKNRGRPDDWTIEDEIMMLSLHLQKEIVSRNAERPIHTIMDWRQNVSKAINKTLDKIEEENIFYQVGGFHDVFEHSPYYESYGNKFNIKGDVINVLGVNTKGYQVQTEAGNEQEEKELMHHKAVAEAKAQILAEQERQKAIEEAEAEEQAETEDVDIVIPFRNYGK